MSWTYTPTESCRDNPTTWDGGDPPESCRDHTGSATMFGLSMLNDSLLGSGVALSSHGWMVPPLEPCRG